MKAPGLMVSLLAAVVMAGGCAVENDIDWSRSPTGLVLDIQSVDGVPLSGDGTPIPVPPSGSANAVEVVFDVAVMAAAGTELFDSDLWVRVSSRPGNLQVIDADRFIGNDVLIAGGGSSVIKVRVWDVFGPVRIWVEDAGFTPRTTVSTVSKCDDGKDNDGDGRADYPDDSGCLSQSDDSEETGSGAAGVSAAIVFDTPTAAQLQGYFEGENEGHYGASPYTGEVVTVDKGNLIVTRVTTDGMYVTDTTGTGDGYNHLFVYTYNGPTTRPICETDEYDSASCVNQDDRPIPLRVCDRLVQVGGAVSEFYGFTEMSFPVWDTVLWDPQEGPCEVPEPVLLQAADVRGNGAVEMEAFEAGLVRLVDVDAPTVDNVVDCDFNDDGVVDFRDRTINFCSDECACREACNNDALCIEINQYMEFGQWPVRLGGPSGVKVWINTRESVPEFDPLAEGAPARYAAITGTLRNLSFLDPEPWIVEPRCDDDIVATGEVLPVTAACVNPRTGE